MHRYFPKHFRQDKPQHLMYGNITVLPNGKLKATMINLNI